MKSFLKEFALLSVVGFTLWLFLCTVVPLPRTSGTGTTYWRPAAPAADSFFACVLALPAAVMAIRRLRKL